MSQFRRALQSKLENPEVRAGYEDSRDRRKLIETMVQVRKDAGLTQQQVADRMGVVQSTVAQFEGSTDPRLSSVQRYARAVGAKSHFIVSTRPEPSQWTATSLVTQQPSRASWEAKAAKVTATRSAFAKAA
ncbi:XRE family transcriptional regulator [Propionibacterium freudenreichii]|uniref:Proteins of Bacteriophage / transcription regulator n=2 Tax=Propionibacterium freudenreichii TaxID=1744 RepID=D7GIA4_PROFC|nr:helix-turn-helix transcriptional regulator [Propionibacterium freudenreichii]ARO12742.1 hypothetical protein BMR99_09860 [Propionibacterium freudenreichii]MCQ1999008.1 helix-turn-helix domain-containing protein [Propionibacterium freudenreichii]MCT2973749.1 XRE family transcriptional regulator [Propionibacterium freudenreichii]MCT3005912.1 XRE family transcriptional regulator [Propionibacterium freudenreichii]MCT3009201.1 XRE family transcriptional regulator [Propionibacterium freudenreichi